MHLGNVYCALMSWLSARAKGGEWLLRIEDLDRGRSRRDYALQLMDDLQWLGLQWDGEPVWQSERDAIYEDYFRRLDVYPCFCSRADLLAASAPHASDGRRVYGGVCRDLSDEERQRRAALRAPAWRVRVTDSVVSFVDECCGEQRIALAQEWGDFVVRRADGCFAYQRAVTVDDALMGITEVVRGVDLLSSVAPQLFLYDSLGFTPPFFAHVPLLCNAAGQRLCKRDKALDMGALRSTMTAEQIVGLIAFYAGLQSQPSPIAALDLLQRVDAERFFGEPKDRILVSDADVQLCAHR